MEGAGVRPRLELVDSLRALAALSIFAYHALFVTGSLTSSNYGFQLRIGVPLFYAISGFLLYLPFASAISAGGRPPAVVGYARRRISRIVPAYWIALPVVAIVLVRSSEVFSPGGIVTYFGFLQVYRLDTFAGGLGQAWTLCVEMSFYIFLPAFAIALAAASARLAGTPAARVVRQLLAISVVIGFSIAWKAFVIGHVGGDLEAALVPLEILPASLDVFGAGMAVAVLVASRGIGGGAPSIPEGSSRLALAAAAVAALAFWSIGEVNGIGLLGDGALVGRGWAELAKKELEAVFAAALVVAAVAARPGSGAVGVVLANPQLRRIGEISYGIYLWHLVLLIVFAGAPRMGGAVEWIGGDSGLIGGLPGVATAFVLTVAVAALSWSFVERPMIASAHRPPR